MSSTPANHAIWARRLSASGCLSLTDPNFAIYLDSIACVGGLRSEFRFPRKECKSNSQQEYHTFTKEAASNNTESINQTGTVEEEPNTEDESNACVYLCGNSLGLQNRRTAEMVLAELDVWADQAVQGHFVHSEGRNWKNMTDLVNPILARLVGAAKSTEVACTGSLTTNLHILMTTFYRPTKERYKILCEANCFPSDLYAFTSQIEMHGLDPKEALISLTPRPREFTLRLEDIISAINREGQSIALVIFSGVQFYTGQAFSIKQITAAGHQQGCIVGWDLAHAIGNIPLELNDWQVDFAAWCSYKYLNAGPGAIAGLFVHENWTSDPTKLGGPHGRPRLAGWFGHNPATRFQMPDQYEPMRGAGQFVHSNSDVLSVISLYSSLQLFWSYPGGMSGLRARSEELTGYIEMCLQGLSSYVNPQYAVDYPDSLNEQQSSRARTVGFTIITPSIPAQRGSQLSLMFLPSGKGLVIKIARQLLELGIVADEREPDVIRFSPVPMYNSFEDCRKTVEALNSILETQNLTSAVSS
ncbi:kynureninase [Puccinia striiformis f. sp. tritici PST-78]|uniref:Kynureninase n=1 Tax=Puccinia striiformis f. sp. tritici PST-78 TaxID=1165861 RepID=A0A0L0VCN0_9BASI|nr:kynureninase [Puccinia striiformis f. sp. tritici PST-78]